jgi:hypothetical protein
MEIRLQFLARQFDRQAMQAYQRMYTDTYPVLCIIHTMQLLLCLCMLWNSVIGDFISVWSFQPLCVIYSLFVSLIMENL